MELKLSDNIINDKLYYSNIAEFEEFETLEKARGRKYYYKSISIFRFYKSYVKTKNNFIE
ncbi:hypothetical protein ACK2GQ_22520 [Clostridioides difficile]